MANAIELIARYLEKQDDIVAAYLFGSQARGTQRDKSDIDVAVLFSSEGDKLARFDRRLEIIIALERVLYFDLKPLLQRRNARMIARILEADHNG